MNKFRWEEMVQNGIKRGVMGQNGIGWQLMAGQGTRCRIPADFLAAFLNIQVLSVSVVFMPEMESAMYE